MPLFYKRRTCPVPLTVVGGAASMTKRIGRRGSMSSRSFGNWHEIVGMSVLYLRTVIVFALLAMFLLITPRLAMGVLIGLGVVALYAQYFRVPAPEKWLSTDRLSWVLLVFSAYLLVNASWSLDPHIAYLKAAYFFFVIAVLHLSFHWIATEERDVLRIALLGVLIGVSVAILHLLVELVTEQSIKRWVYTTFSTLRPFESKHLTMQNGVVVHIGPYDLNRNIANLMLLYWPLAILLSLRFSGMRLALAIAGLAALWALIALSSYHETSSIALASSLVIFLICRAWPLIGQRVLIAFWCASVLLVVPAADLAHKAKLYQADWLPKTARARIILWDATAQRIFQTPILGVGIRSTRVLLAQDPNKNTVLDGQNYPRSTGRHAHNVYLQTWYELGAVGAVFLLIIGLLILRSFSRISEALRPFACAAFTLISVLAAFSWGIWQTWYVSSLAASIIFLAIALAYAGRILSKNSEANRS